MFRLLKPACHHQLLHLLNRRDAEAPQEMARQDLRFFQNNPKNEGCTECIHLFLLLSDLAVAGLKTNKPWWFIYAPLQNSLFTCPYLRSLGQQESQRPVEGKLSSARFVITRLLDSSEPDPSLPLRRCLLIVQDWKWGKNDTKITRWSCFSSAARRLRPIWLESRDRSTRSAGSFADSDQRVFVFVLAFFHHVPTIFVDWFDSSTLTWTQWVGHTPEEQQMDDLTDEWQIN